ncbi:hypothetical protein N9142_04690 [Akkermansiaceae bacterium]|nr:hypothetical protein [Akkermansiaceae bacterium]MDB4434417.1 hypothetical protein [Akkermansiaceae bacterium]MDB4467572.1 hypothetical protein [Akkermansiaceae bacterium]
MKLSLFALLILSTVCLAAPPTPGESSDDVIYSIASNSLDGSNQFTQLTNSQLSATQGKVVLIAYYTPW